jgi:tape measure domain-containing protein
MADEIIRIDVSDALSDIAQLKGGMVDLQAQASKTGKAIDSAFDTGAAQGVADAVNDLQKEYNDLKRSADTLKSALRQATDPTLIDLYVKSIGRLELGMNKLEKAGRAAGVSLKETAKGAGTGKQVFENFFGAFTKVGLITAAIAAVGKFVSYSVNLAEQISTAKRSLEGFTGSAAEAEKIVNSLIATGQKNFIPTEDILAAGKSLLAFGENADNLPDVLGRIADISAATGKNFNELANIYGKARTSGVLFAEDINQLTDAGIPIIQEFAKQLGVSTSEVKKLASEGKISFEELQLAFFNLTKEGAKFADQAQAQSQTISGAWTRLVSVVQPAIEWIGDKISYVVTGALNILSDLAEGIGSLFSDTVKPVNIDLIDKEALDQDRREYEAALNEQARLEKEAAEARKKLNKKNAEEAVKVERDRQQAIINGMKEGVDKQVAIENLRYKMLLKELRRFHLDTTEATEQHELNLADIYRKEAERQRENLHKILEIRQQIYDLDTAAFEKAEKKKQETLEKRSGDAEYLKRLKDQEVAITEEAGVAVIAALRRRGASEQEVKEAQAALDVELQRARLQNELEFQLTLLGISNDGDGKRTQEILNNIDLIRAKLGNLTTDTGGDTARKTLLERLGFDEDSLSALNDVKSQVIGFIQEIAAAEVQEAENVVNAAQERVRAAEEALEKELDLKEQGFANNAALRQRELEQAKADEAKALEQKKAAQRRQILLDSALQLSSLITSSANIIKGFSTIPIFGLPLGIAAVAAMFGAFISAKSKALQATRFKHGGEGRVDGNSIIVGASHDAGGVGIEAEGGEFFGTDGKRFGVVNKRMTSKHFDLLKAINKDDKSGMRAALERITTPSMNRDAVLNTVGGVSSGTTGSNETMSMLKDWKERSTKEKPSTTVEGKYAVTRQGNYTRRVLIK